MRLRSARGVYHQSAQSPSQSLDRAELLQPPTFSEDPYDAVTGTDSSHAAAASPNDPDLGEQAILKRQERYRPFTVSFGAPFFYTSNVALTRAGERSDVVFAPAMSVTYAPQLTKTLFATFSVGQQQFYYNRCARGYQRIRQCWFHQRPRNHDQRRQRCIQRDVILL